MHKFLSTYTDIVEQQRIVYVYDMWLDDAHISTSITTVTLEPADEGTRLTFVEQGVHLDGHATAEGREEGTGEILERRPLPGRLTAARQGARRSVTQPSASRR